jgi:hypothetical protein
MSTADPGGSGLSILLLADPGVPAQRVQATRKRLEKRLQEAYGASTRLEHRTETLQLDPEGALDFRSVHTVADEYPRADAVLMLTEMPRHDHNHPLVAEIYDQRNLAVVSCPTLGFFATKWRLITTVMACLARMDLSRQPREGGSSRLRWGRWSHENSSAILYARTGVGATRTVAGMVRANQPLSTAPRLSGSLATASAVGAFGIFYSSVWQMSATQSTGRLIAIGALAIGAMVIWLMWSNRLWDRPVTEGRASLVTLYNISTVLTLLLCVLALYAALLVVILIGGLIIISPEYMEQVLGTQVDFTSYLDIAWLSAALGVIAGGLGTRFDSQTDVRRLTHAQRERQRIIRQEAPGEAEERGSGRRAQRDTRLPSLRRARRRRTSLTRAAPRPHPARRR